MSFKIERIRTGKKAEEVADYMRVSTTTISMWENGGYLPKSDKLQKLADYYGCSVDALLDSNPIKPKRIRKKQTK